MNEFKTYHPIVNFVYFAFVIGLSMFFMHPVCLCISLCSAFTYSVMLSGKKALKANLLYMLPTMLVTALVNPAFNHEGVTVLTYLPSGNPLTLESVLYGLCAAVMLVSVICHFSNFNAVMTSDKFIYLFGRVIPSLSLILSMTLRFVPRFIAQLKVVTNAQKCVGKKKGIKNAIAILSILVTWALENAVETADSMKARGYGLKGRTAYSNFIFDKRDAFSLICILVSGLYVFIGSIMGGMRCRYFPSVAFAPASLFSISVFIAYFLLCTVPIIVEIREVKKWRAIESKI